VVRLEGRRSAGSSVWNLELIVGNAFGLREQRRETRIERQRVECLFGAHVEAAIERGHEALVMDEVVGVDIVGRCGNGTHGRQGVLEK
jgi:hypothetical protein